MAIIDNYSKEELENIIKNSFSYKEVLDKLGYSTHSGSNNEILKRKIDEYNIDISHFKLLSPIKRNEENIFIKDSTASQATLRRWYLKNKYTEYKCSICGQEPFWNGKELTLILDHINGQNHDDRLENLRWVCPNCNQQLETTGFTKEKAKEYQKIQKKNYCSECGKEITEQSITGLCFVCANKARRFCKRPNREELKKLIRKLPFTKIAEQYNVSDNAIRKWCDSENLPRKKSDINKYNDIEWEKI